MKKTLALMIPVLLISCKDGGGVTESDSGSTGASGGDPTGSPTASVSDGSGGTGGGTGGGTTGNPTGEPTTSTTSVTTMSSETSGGCAGAPVFETDIIPIFENSCGANDNACHSRVAYTAISDQECRGWLALENMALGSVIYAGADEGKPTGCPDMPLYERLVQLDAWQCEEFDPRMRYVTPCKPEESYIVRKIDGGPYCSLNSNGMPVPTQPMPMGKVLDQAEIDTITAWIAAGAPRLGDECPIDCSGTDPGPQDPVAQINHPGDGEDRAVDVPIPFVGLADDPQDGMIPADKLVWTSDIEGQIGVGDNFNAPLTIVGKHTITLTATDIDGNEGTASIVLNIQ
jgi:hypothetical protein